MDVEQFLWTAESGWTPPIDQTRMADSAQLVLVFGRGAGVAADPGLPLIRRTFPRAHVVGCSTGGEILGPRVADGSIAVTVVRFAHSRVAAAKVAIGTPDDSFAAGQALVRQLDPNGLRHVFVVSEGLRVIGSELVAGINAALPAGVSLSGGFAADSNNLQSTHVWCNDTPQQAVAAAVGFYGERLLVGLGVTGRWGPFGPDRIITRSHKNVLYEFDGRPALALYKQYLGPYADGLPATGLMFPLELKLRDQGGRVLRVLLAIDEKEQSITFAGNVPEGATARFTVGHIEDLIAGTLTAAQASHAQLTGRSAQLSLLVSCNARRAVLKQRVDEEVEAVRDVLGDSAALAGFYSYGEIGPSEAGTAFQLHNQTMLLTNLAEQ